jgi:para-nitrobenzyl esterase
MRMLPAADLLNAVAVPRMAIGPANGIVVDGWILPRPPAEVFATRQELRVPLLLGNNARERTPPEIVPGDLANAATAMYGALAGKAAALYGFGVSPEPQPDPLYGGTAAQWVVDTMYRCPVVAQLLWHAGAGNPAYEYQFDHAPAGRGALGAVHGAEVPFVFGLAGPSSARYTAADQEISATLQDYWTGFAKTGSPGAAGLPQWPKFDSAQRAYIEFTDSGPIAGEGLRRPFCDLYVENVKRLMTQLRAGFPDRK